MQRISSQFILFIALAVFGVAAVRPAFAQSYTITDLGTLGGTDSIAVRINNKGQVVGESTDAAGNYRAFLWTADSGMVNLGTLPGTTGDVAGQGINDAGQVVGAARFGNPYHAFLWTPTSANGTSGTMSDLGTLGGDNANASDINNNGQVVGASTNGNDVSRAFLWTASGGMIDLGDLGGGTSYAASINDGAQIVGSAPIASGDFHAFLRSASGTWTDLGTLGGARSGAVGVNASGQVVGWSEIADGNTHAFFYSGGVMTDIGTLGGPYSNAGGLNDAGQVVGISRDSGTGITSYHAIIWDSVNGMRSLDDLIPSNSGWALKWGYAINNVGQIIGWGYKNGDTSHQRAYLLTPTGTTTVSLTGVSLDPFIVMGGSSSTGTVALSGVAPTGGITVDLASDNAAATVPASVTVPEGASTATFTISTTPVTQTTSVTVSASYNGVTKTATLTIQHPVLLSKLTLSPSTVPGCKNVTGKLFLNLPAPSGGAIVSLTNTNPAATCPASITIPAGKTSKTFVITTTPVSTTQAGTVTASYNAASVSATLKVRPIGVKSLTLSPNPVVGGNSVTGTVTLECAAAPGDIVVTLTSTDKTLAQPSVSSLTISAGQVSGTFTVSTASVSVVKYVTIKAAANGITKGKRLRINP